MVSPTLPRCAGFLSRPNRVPYFQRLFQKNDGVRLWWKSPKSGYYLYPYYASAFATSFLTIYAMGRTVLGHKTWFGKG